MELLPPVGWADVATKHDLLQLEGRLEARIEAKLERGLRGQTWRLLSLNVATMGAMVGALVAAAKL